MFKNAIEALRNLEENEGAILGLSYVGNIFSLVYFAMPLIQIIQAYKSKLDKDDIPLLLLITIILNCLLWLINAFSSDDLGDWIPLLISNGAGIVINVSLLFLYLNLLLNKNWKQFLFYGIFTLDVIVEISYFMFRYIILNDRDSKEDTQKKSEFHMIGFVATVINVIMYSSSYSTIVKIIKGNRAELLPIFTIGSGILTTIIFLIQGMVQYNTYDDDERRMYAIETMVSNGISFLSLAIQGGIWFFYYLTGEKRNEIKIDEKLDKIGVDVSVADTSGDVSGAA